jgi:hypothetical protein
MWWWLACSDPVESDDPLPELYSVQVEVAPAPVIAGVESEVTLRVRDAAGAPVPDLQQTHERMLHTFLLPADLSSFAHVHQEDFEAVDADDLRTSTFSFPYAFPRAGDWLLAFDFARQNRYLRAASSLQVDGAPAMDVAPAFRSETAVLVEDLSAELEFRDGPPTAGQVAAFQVTLAREGAPVTDVVPWLGTDGHLALASFDLQSVGHTHAWIDGMDAMPPGHEMPHTYDGPEIPFQYTFPRGGDYRLWVQVATAAHPTPYLLSFDVAVR